MQIKLQLQTQIQIQIYTDIDMNTDIDTDINAEKDTDIDTDKDANTNTDTNIDTNRDKHIYTNTDRNTDTGSPSSPAISSTLTGSTRLPSSCSATLPGQICQPFLSNNSTLTSSHVTSHITFPLVSS